MAGESPDVVLYDKDGNMLAVQDATPITLATPALMVAGSDGTNSRYIKIDSSGNQIMVGTGTAGTPSGGIITIQGVSGGQVVPISGSVSITGTVGVTQSTSPWVSNISQFGGSNVVTGTGTSGAGIPRITISNDSNILATQSGTWTVAQGSPNSLANGWPVEITDGTNILGTAAHPIRIDPTGTTIQPVSGTVSATQGTSPWVSNITQFGSNNVVTGTGASGAGIPRVTVSNDSNILATQSGTWTVQQGTPPWSINQTQINGSAVTVLAAGEQKVATEGLAASGAAASGNPVLVGGKDDSGNARTVRTDPAGDVYIVPRNVPSNATATGNPFGQGSSPNAGKQFPLRATVYTEQTTNAQRSIKSSSANDTNTAGTGARQVVITYLDQTGAGPFTETVNLNGTTAVNTVSTTICFIEEIHVVSVGSTGSNQGTISLFTTTGGGGSAFASIGVGNVVSNGTVGDNQTLWAHHYTPTGKTTTIVATAIGTNGNQTGNGLLRTQNPLVATSVELQITGTIVLDASSPTITRTYQIPIQIVGPSRTTFYGVSGGTNTNFYGVFEYWDA